jgi:hypothetical protein
MASRGCVCFVGNLPGDVREREIEDLFYKVSRHADFNRILKCVCTATWHRSCPKRAGDPSLALILETAGIVAAHRMYSQ